MNRRSFLNNLVGAAIAVSTAGRLVLQPETEKPKLYFDPIDYVGSFTWVNVSPKTTFPFMGEAIVFVNES